MCTYVCINSVKQLLCGTCTPGSIVLSDNHIFCCSYVYTVPTSNSVVTVLQSDESQKGDDGARRQVENTNGLL